MPKFQSSVVFSSSSVKIALLRHFDPSISEQYFASKCRDLITEGGSVVSQKKGIPLLRTFQNKLLRIILAFMNLKHVEVI
jgi:hypothetical protein